KRPLSSERKRALHSGEKRPLSSERKRALHSGEKRPLSSEGKPALHSGEKRPLMSCHPEVAPAPGGAHAGRGGYRSSRCPTAGRASPQSPHTNAPRRAAALCMSDIQA